MTTTTNNAAGNYASVNGITLYFERWRLSR
jgi:hypothetical protein